jgi:hypothetical protein
MPTDLAKLAHKHVFELKTSSLGTVQCGSYSMKVMADLEDLLKEDDLTGPAYARALLARIGRLTPADDQQRDELPTFGLSEEQISQVTDDELDAFAREFLAHHPM